MRALLASLACVGALAIASPAAAHVGLRYPPSRYGQDVLKIGPCGLAGGVRSNNVTVLESGASINVVWDEYINHPGHFRISFDADGDDDFVNPACLSGCVRGPEVIELYSNASVLLDGIADTPYGGQSSATITLPDIECERCTLQLIQVMYDKPPYVVPGDDIYYQCADLVLRRSAATPTASPTTSPTSAPSPSPAPSPSATPTVSPSPPLPTPTPACGEPGAAGCPICVGDCDGSGDVSADELVTMVGIALGFTDVSACAAGDVDGDAAIQVDEIIAAVHRSLEGCAP